MQLCDFEDVKTKQTFVKNKKKKKKFVFGKVVLKT